MKADIFYIVNLIKEIMSSGDFIRLTLSSPLKSKKQSHNGILKIVINPIIVKNNLSYQTELFIEKKVNHLNFNLSELLTFFSSVGNNFKNINIISKNFDFSIINNNDVFFIKKIKREERGIAIKEQNKIKNYILQQGHPVDFLIDLGIMKENGDIIKDSFNKFKQINKYLEFIESLISELNSKKLIGSSIKIVDFGSGKSYLTFSLYYYLKVIKELDVEIIGLDLKKDVMENCSKLATKYGFNSLYFYHGDIKDFKNFSSVDIVFSLHACDTATDYAILKGLELDAKAILAVPCCQKEFNQKLNSSQGEIKSILFPLMDYGILKENFSTLLTDGFRGKILELCGYSVNVMEFIQTEHTPKNTLIRGIINTSVDKNLIVKKKKNLLFLMDFMGIKPLIWDLAYKFFKI